MSSESPGPSDAAASPNQPVADDDPAFEALLTYLRENRGFDFTGYKRPSLMRRVAHRMKSLGMTRFADYTDYLEVHPDEFTELFNTILINVTSFFRDAEAWAFLADPLVRDMLGQAGDEAPIRVWCAGCAAGQEAYSLAMVLIEAMGAAAFRRRVKIYATDVDDEALALARQASYTDAEVRDLPAGYLERYFEQDGTRWTFRKDLRRNVIFGRNDLVQDAPISRIDLLTCRNTLMSFNAETQSRILSRLAFALKPDGVLFLGKAEMLLNHTDSFVPIDLKRRFFRKAPVAPSAAAPANGRQPAATRDEDLRGLQSEAFLTSPIAQVVVNSRDRVALLNHRARTLLGLTDRDIGRPFQDLEMSYRPSELRSHLASVRASLAPEWLRGIEWHRSAQERLVVDIEIVPLIDGRGRLLGTSILITDVSRFRQLQDEVEAANRQLESAYEQLQSTNEELETTNEELQSTVEELETTNEELQSTNEELETMNEELQSMNDELQAANEELRVRTTEISALNHFMEAVLGSLDAAVVVLNPDLAVRAWNRQAQELWGLREEETIGQHFLNLDIGLPADELKGLIRSVVNGGEGASQRLAAVNRRGRPVELTVTVTPLRSADDAPPGALLVMEQHTPSE